jgi:GMP synthase (glutamine-hydrolysing)
MRCLALRHIPCEDLGTFAGPIRRRLGEPVYLDMDGAAAPPAAPDAVADAELVVSLGGPMAVYEADRYPFLQREFELIRARLAAGKPTLGLCLGSQIMAAATGGRVYSGGRQEIGWHPVEFDPRAATDPVLGCLAQGSNIFFQWHGDTFDLPPGSQPIGSSPLFPNQGFMLGRHAVALQFHAEVGREALEAWLDVYSAGLNPGPGVMSAEQMRAGATRHAASLTARGQAFLNAWLRELWPD